MFIWKNESDQVQGGTREALEFSKTKICHKCRAKEKESSV